MDRRGGLDRRVVCLFGRSWGRAHRRGSGRGRHTASPRHMSLSAGRPASCQPFLPRLLLMCRSGRRQGGPSSAQPFSPCFDKRASLPHPPFAHDHDLGRKITATCSTPSSSHQSITPPCPVAKRNATTPLFQLLTVTANNLCCRQRLASQQ